MIEALRTLHATHQIFSLITSVFTLVVAGVVGYIARQRAMQTAYAIELLIWAYVPIFALCFGYYAVRRKGEKLLAQALRFRSVLLVAVGLFLSIYCVASIHSLSAGRPLGAIPIMFAALPLVLANFGAFWLATRVSSKGWL